ncbi:MAG: sulfotransferase [Anaerolineae bacterium]|nr:sulfotransferase [Anaerolineae bacterium]
MEPLSLNKRIVYVTGLPRAGSTLLCQLLGHHPEIYSPGHSSPLNRVFDQLRGHFSDDPFLLAQLDVDFDLVYTRLINAYRGFLNGWFAETDKPVVVDKNRGWLRMIETVRVLDPEFRMLVCIRDLRQVFGSIEAQHQKTVLLDYPDHMAPHSAYERADTLFGKEALIGGPLRAIEDFLKDVDPVLRAHVGFVAFESLVSDPVETMALLYRWLDLPSAPFDPQHLTIRAHESDSHYRWKYRHDTRATIRLPALHSISPRIEQEILEHFGWFYDRFYTGALHSDEVAQPKPGQLL